MNREEYRHLCTELSRHNRLYYAEAKPEISDYEYDLLSEKLLAYEKKHPDHVEAYSPSARIGESLTEGFQTREHEVPMLSLANTYSDEEIVDFLRRVEKITEKKNPAYCAELKMDGTAVSVIYKKGIFDAAVTRGNGERGDDVSQNVKTIRELPLQLTADSPPDLLEVRGEVFLDLPRFHHLNEQREEDGLPVWANPRNAAAGTLKLLNPKEVASRGLRIVFYAIARDSSKKNRFQYDVHAALRSYGLPTLQETALCRTEEEIYAFRDRIHKIRSSLPFEIDGIVLKVNDLQLYGELGTTMKHPRWAVAYKFAPESALTKIREIIVRPGRTGVLTPVALLDPVRVSGSVIARVTLHNGEEIERKDLRIGDTVRIEKGGDVIPKIVSVVKESREKGALKWEMPNRCPSCGTEAVELPGETALRCPNRNCPGRHLRHLIFFAGKEAMNIEHLGEKIVETLLHQGLVKKSSDFFRLREEQLLQVEGFREKSVHRLLESIEKSKRVPLSRFIMALDIRYVGISTAEALADSVSNIRELFSRTKEDLEQIDGVGEKVATSVYDYFHREENRSEVEDLLALGICPQKEKIRTDHLFCGKTFVLTGSLESFDRDEASKLIKERGGKVSGSVGKKTDFLLVGESPGSKYEKAKALGIPVLEEKEFLRLL